MATTDLDTKPGKLRIRASVVCVHRAQLLCVHLRDPRTRIARLFVPGGAIEAGETPVMAAEREAFEETGYRIRIDAESEVVAHYPYEWDGVLRQVTTYFFRGSLIAPDAPPEAVSDASYHEGVVWLPLSEVQKELAFEPTILSSVQQLVR
jgi:8-oxo-dGTP pyrophosphatase MutT (NUDIX family)